MEPILRPKNRAEEIALFRSEIIGGLVRSELARGELSRTLRYLSRKRFRPPGADQTRTYSSVTLRRWYDAYRKGGLEALMPKPRRDRGHARELTPEQRDLLCDIRKEYPSASAELILRTLVADGRLKAGSVSPATVRRLFKEHGLDRVAVRDGNDSHTRRRWQAEAPNCLWHGDVCHGPSIILGGNSAHKKPLRVHAIMDDASRYIIAIAAYHTEREQDMLDLFVNGMRRHGLPKAMYLDNGSTYRGNVLRLACERLGTTLIHAQPYDPEARGKMERFWRTLRQGCLDFIGSLTSLHEINVRLYAFIDEHYHRSSHGGLMGRKPSEIWTQYQRERDPDELDEQKLREALTMREARRVRKDSTLSFDGTVYELDAGFLAGHRVTVARSFLDRKEPPWVEHKGQKITLSPVAPVKNSRRRRKPKSPQPSSSVPFDPPGALLDRAVRRPPRHQDSEGKPK